MVRGRSQKKMKKDVEEVLKNFYKEKQNLKVKEARKAIKSVYKGNDIKKKLKLVNEIRELIFNDMFMLPSFTIKFAIIFMILWITFCIILSIIYGISFDVLYQNDGFSFDNIGIFNNGNNNALNINLNPFNQDCFNNDILLDISNRVSDEDIEIKNSSLYNYVSSFGDNISDAGSWLTSLFISILLSIFVWQPLTIYVATWIKIWAFTWDLRVRAAPGTIKRLCCYVCGCKKPDSFTHSKQMSSIGQINPVSLPNIKDGQETFQDINDVNWMDENAKLFTTESKDTKLTDISDNETPTNNKITTLRNSKTLSRKSTLTNILSLKINDGRSIRTDVVIRNERPMDILSFYSHDILFINDDDVYNPNKNNNNNNDNKLVSTVKHIEMNIFKTQSNTKAIQNQGSNIDTNNDITVRYASVDMNGAVNDDDNDVNNSDSIEVIFKDE